ncbi:MAG TPA: AraD1 family protein [Opitutaceae bacterium]|nr:AraD1 family protein [Opitutaceae bacterium]
MTRLIQIQNGAQRRVALVEEPKVRCLEGFDSVYALAQAALAGGAKLPDLIRRHATGAVLDYDPIYRGKSEWRLLTPVDFPGEPARCLVSGTGLTHLGSAKNRQAMHAASETETDSMRMFRWGVEGGKPAPGRAGTAPEWFYKGCGTILRAPNEPLLVPVYAEDGGEEAEIAGVYLIGPDGKPHRLGMALGNEFSDHRFEKRNYLNLAGSKIRTCSLGPELVIDPEFQTVTGKAVVERGGTTLWSKDIRTGEAEMCHSLRNIEHHHFKFETHRRPGDVHVHYYGACALSFGDGVQLSDGDVMSVEFAGFGRPLRNPLAVVSPSPETVIAVQSFA